MMRFMRFSRQGTSLAKPAGRAAAILFAGLAGGCSAQISGFDFPGFALNDDPKPQQTASAAGRGNPSYLGNDGYGSGGGDNAPRTYRENGVSSQSLPDASPPSSYASSDRRYDSGPSNTNANNGRYNSTANTTYSTDRRYATAPTTTNSTNRYDPQPQPSLSNPGDQVEVQPGDTLYGLSRRHRVVGRRADAGQQPDQPEPAAGPEAVPAAGLRRQPLAAGPPCRRRACRPPPASVPADLDAKYRGSYTMRQGDSLYGISRSYGVSVAELQQANGITDARGVKAGAVLRVPGRQFPASRCSRSRSIRRRRSRNTSSRPVLAVVSALVGAAADYPQRPEQRRREQQQPIHSGGDAQRQRRGDRLRSCRRRSRSRQLRAATTSCAGR